MTEANPSGTAGLEKSFEERLTFPDKANGGDTPTAKFSWADDAETPTNASNPSGAQTDGAADSKPADMAQQDGASQFMNGSALDEPEFDVNVKLADLQEDPNNPLYSVKAFDQLNL